ncbi:FecR domain-containing protein [Candidatus Dojkabacteria bacterium]|uniref:FecR domain-containing protein n=1 Tax=Candidatus Dojkabacteria bacterium TaxID=2099670 RepID=A0A955LAF7_9BACT|nr:FecR domain-containing protein [Candidatus Dojkabacteria bacterium]
METGNKNHKETSLYIRQNRISPAEVEMSSGQAKSRIKEEVLDAYLNYYSSNMKSNGLNYFKISLFSLAVVVFAATLAFFLDTYKSNTNTPTLVATDLKAAVTYTEGDVEVMLEDGRWVDLGDQETLEQGDSFRVVGEGKGILTLDDGSAIRLASNTTINLTSLDAMDIVITNEGGEVYTRMDKSERSFTVETADATYTSLGTAYKTVQTSDKKGVYVYESKVEVKPTNVDKVVVNEGEKYFLNQEKQAITYEDTTDSFSKFNKEQDKQEFGSEAKVFTNLENQKMEQEKNAAEESQIKQEAQEQNQVQVQQNASGSISLGGHADASAGGIYLNWVPSNLDVSQGFKVVFSKSNSSPMFGVDSAKYYSDAGTRSAFIPFADGKTYHFRVCRYTGNGCDTYSNTMTITAPGTAKSGSGSEGQVSGVNSISLKSTGGGNVMWAANGYSKQGFKVVWSLVSNPTYPNRSTDKYIYLSDPSSSSASVYQFDGPGTYYVRVCEYLGGSCGAYSNQITVEL